MADPIWVTWMECRTAPDMPTSLPSDYIFEREVLPYTEYLAIYKSIGGPVNWDSRLAWTPEELQSYLAANQSRCFVLRQNGRVAGLCELAISENHEAELQHFGVEPAFQGKGLGLYMLQSALFRVFAESVTRIWLHTDEWDSPAAQKLYVKAGFKIYDRKFMDPTPL